MEVQRGFQSIKIRKRSNAPRIFGFPRIHFSLDSFGNSIIKKEWMVKSSSELIKATRLEAKLKVTKHGVYKDNQ